MWLEEYVVTLLAGEDGYYREAVEGIAKTGKLISRTPANNESQERSAPDVAPPGATPGA